MGFPHMALSSFQAQISASNVSDQQLAPESVIKRTPHRIFFIGFMFRV
jgi:hypothetical protein